MKPKKRLAALESKVEELESEKVRLEGLLDVTDPDAALTGDQAQQLYRRVSGGFAKHSRDFSDADRERMIRLSHLAYAVKGPAENLIEAHLDFLLGDDLVVKAKPDAAEGLQDLLDEIWQDTRSRLDLDVDELTLSALLEGELVLRTTISELDGHLESGWFDPLEVREVVQDRKKRDAFLVVDGPTPNEVLTWFVLNNLEDGIEIEPWPEDRENKPRFTHLVTEEAVTADGGGTREVSRGVHGLCFYYAHNRPKGAARGRGELSSVLDMVDAQDELIWSTVDVQNAKRMIVMHVKDAAIRSPAQARKVLQNLGLLTVPRNPKVLATNDKVSVELMRPESVNSEEWLAKELGTWIMGAKGMPESWRGSQAEQGLAGARAADFVPLRRLRRKQKKFMRFWRRYLQVALELRRRAGVAVPEGDFEFETLEVGGKDKARGAELLKAVASSAVQIASVGAAKPELLNAIFIQALLELGVAVTKEQEGLPDDGVGGAAGDVAAAVRQMLSQRSRKTGENNQDEEDRDRPGEKTA